jgi:hypothetical protein
MTRKKTGGRQKGTPNRPAAASPASSSFPPKKRAHAGAMPVSPPPVAVRQPGRPRYEPNEKDRKIAEGMTACGIDQDGVIGVLGISKPTLRKYYRRELETALAKANAQVGGKLFALAMGGNVAAAIFWMKARAGWSEKILVQDVPADDSDLTKLTDAQLEARAAYLRGKIANRPRRNASGKVVGFPGGDSVGFRAVTARRPQWAPERPLGAVAEFPPVSTRNHASGRLVSHAPRRHPGGRQSGIFLGRHPAPGG